MIVHAKTVRVLSNDAQIQVRRSERMSGLAHKKRSAQEPLFPHDPGDGIAAGLDAALGKFRV